MSDAERIARLYFNSRPCVRGDNLVSLCRECHEFQFTPLREGRQQNYTIVQKLEYLIL